jgi:thiol:disulfide interchange protein DsbA
MRLIQKLLFAVTLGVAAAGAIAAPNAPKEGVEYLRLPEAQPTSPAAGKVEVTEFFTYSCPHCYGYDPVLAEWVKKNADKVDFKRVHVAVNAGDQVLQRVFATTEAMGITEQTHAKIFNAVHRENIRIGSDEAAFDWAAKAGVDRAKFIDTYRSFGMQARVNRLRGQTSAHRIEQWPMVAVGGKYMTSPYFAASAVRPVPNEPEQQKMSLQVLDFLVAKAKAEQK